MTVANLHGLQASIAGAVGDVFAKIAAERAQVVDHIKKHLDHHEKTIAYLEQEREAYRNQIHEMADAFEQHAVNLYAQMIDNHNKAHELLIAQLGHLEEGPAPAPRMLETPESDSDHLGLPGRRSRP